MKPKPELKPEQKLTFEEYVRLRKTRRVGETKRIIKQNEKDKNEKDKNEKDKNESVISRDLKIIRILKDNGIDFTKIQLNKGKRGILLEEIEQDGIDIQEIIKKYKLDGKFKLRTSIVDLKATYNNCKMTKEERREAEELGVPEIETEIERESIISKTLKIARILKDNGIDFAKIQLNKGKRGILLEEIEQDDIDIQEIIKKYELDGKFKIRTNIVILKAAYNNLGQYKLTEEERRETEELGVPEIETEIETEIESESIISKTLKIARILKDNGINFAPIKFTRGNEGILLEEIEQDDIDIQEIIKKYKLDGKFKIGMGVSSIRTAYNNPEKYGLTEEKIREIEELGLLERETAITETLKLVRILKENGVDVTQIKLTRVTDRKQEYLLLKDIEQDGIDIEKIIKENKLDPDFKIGMRIVNLRSAYNNLRDDRITEAERKEARELGIIPQTLIQKVEVKQKAIEERRKAKELYERWMKTRYQDEITA